MHIQDFRRHAHAVVEWMADYLATVEERPVRAQVMPGDLLAALPLSAPETPETFAQIMADFEQLVMPGITHWQHPRFFAYFQANSSPPSVLAEMLTATLAAQCMLWETSPSANELETRMMDWLRELTGLPAAFQGSIQDSGSSANLAALLAARERASGGRAAAEGLAGLSPMAVYASAEAHSSVEKAAKVAGFGAASVRKIATNSEQAMRYDALQRAIGNDRALGIVPACVVACLGATGLGSIDPLAKIGALCKRERVFLHVDAAWAGAALILPEQRHLASGIEAADSVVWNPHKWLFTNFDCATLFLRNPAELASAMAANPAYLASPSGGGMPDYRDWGVPLARRFRALKLWFVLRSYGVEQLRTMLRAHIAYAHDLADRIRGEPGFELMAGPRLSLLAFRWCPPGVPDAELDALNDLLLEAVNNNGRTYLTRTLLDGRVVIRFVVGQTYTERRHVQEGWQAVVDIARVLTGAASRA